MRKLLIVLCLLLFAPIGANAAITVATLGTRTQTASTTSVLTTAGNACAAGSTIIVFTSYVTVADTLSSATDSAGNTYKTPIDNIAGTSVGIGWVYAVNTGTNLPIGGTITLTYSGSTVSAMAAHGGTLAPVSDASFGATLSQMKLDLGAQTSQFRAAVENSPQAQCDKIVANAANSGRGGVAARGRSGTYVTDGVNHDTAAGPDPGGSGLHQ